MKSGKKFTFKKGMIGASHVWTLRCFQRILSFFGIIVVNIRKTGI